MTWSKILKKKVEELLDTEAKARKPNEDLPQGDSGEEGKK